MSWKSCFTATLLSCTAVNGTFAKPADLPVDLRINLAGAPEVAPVNGDDQPVTPDTPRALEVFERAERHRQLGQRTEARRGYEETHLLAPTSSIGRQAMQRIRELEVPSNDFTEEQEPPLNRSAYRPAVEPRREVNRIKPTRAEYQDMLRDTELLETLPIRPEAY